MNDFIYLWLANHHLRWLISNRITRWWHCFRCKDMECKKHRKENHK